VIFLAMVVAGGCSFWRRNADEASLKNLLPAPEPPELIRQAANPSGLKYTPIQSFGVVNGLAGTGGVEPASQQRELVMMELKRREIPEPNAFLDADSTAIVLIEAVIPPGGRKGDPIDLQVRTPKRNAATRDACSSLKGGWLMPARIAYTEMFEDRPRSSDTLAMGQGPIIVRDCFEVGEDPALQLEGRILAGARLQKDSPLLLLIRPEYQHVDVAKQLAGAINQRFHFFDGTQRRGIATPKKDDLIEIEIPERYRHNVHRLMAVIGALSPAVDVGDRQARLPLLTKQLAEPTTAQDAALKLEGLGEEGVSALLTGLGRTDPELRFYAAEALAYLDHEEAIEVLVELIRDQPAFRYQALLALSDMPQRRAAEGLRELFNHEGTETRCGAFDAIRRREDHASIVQGKPLRVGRQSIAEYYALPTTAEPLVAVSLRRHASVIEFGGPTPVQLQHPVSAGNGLMIVAHQSGGLQINRIVTGKSPAQTVVPATIEGVCVGVARAGGGYAGIVECLRLLKQQEAFAAQLAIDVLPEPLRKYHREGAASTAEDDLPPSRIDPDPPAKPERAWYDPLGWLSRAPCQPRLSDFS
jgi:hypothetical protein